MNDNLIRVKVHQAVDAYSASMQDDPYLAQRILTANRRKEVPRMKKLSTGMIIAIVLMLLSVTAVAVGLSIEQVWQQAFDKMGTWGEVWNIGEPTEEDLTMEEAEQVVSQAMDQSQKVTARRYLKLLKWLLLGIAAVAAYYPVCSLIAAALFCYYLGGIPGLSPDIGIIGGADGPTAVLIATAATPLPPWLLALLLGILAITCIIIAFHVRSLERKLK